MAKLKTSRTAAKRFKKTANGYKHRAAYRNHILTKKSKDRKRELRGMRLVHKSDEKAIKNLIGE